MWSVAPLARVFFLSSLFRRKKFGKFLQKMYGMYLFQEVGKPELGFPNHELIQLWVRTSARRARVLTHNCMNEWLGEPVLVSQLPGRGILRIYINNLAIKGVFVEKIVYILTISLKNKKVPMVCH